MGIWACWLFSYQSQKVRKIKNINCTFLSNSFLFSNFFPIKNLKNNCFVHNFSFSYLNWKCKIFRIHYFTCNYVESKHCIEVGVEVLLDHISLHDVKASRQKINFDVRVWLSEGVHLFEVLTLHNMDIKVLRPIVIGYLPINKFKFGKNIARKDELYILLIWESNFDWPLHTITHFYIWVGIQAKVKK